MALARSETEKGNYARSLELAQPALEAFKESPEGLFILATDYMKTGDRAAAAAIGRRLEAARRRAPRPGRSGSPSSSPEDGLVAEAIAVLEHARQAGPPSYELAFALGGAYLRER